MNLFLKALDGTRVYPLTDRYISGLSHEQQVLTLSSSGARVIQLREKELEAREFYGEAAAAIRIARQRGVHIIVNDRVDIAQALKADGVHLGQSDLPPTVARQLLGNDAIIGVSTHNLEQAKLAAEMPVDYVALGPIFPTTTKQSSNPPVGPEGVRQARELLGDIPLVAIGGITEATGRQLLEAGATALAVVTDCWKPHNSAPETRRRLFQL
ncbi:MAG TPA: thiamine phosphate synthase [Pyrinomonadaceae bacterium]|nr:thiamine phosphate synthase [Pyrinomonadaceae bacterium]